MASFYELGSAASRVKSHYKETVYFLPLSLWKFLVLFSWCITLEGCKADLSMEPPNGLEPGTPGLRIQRLKH